MYSLYWIYTPTISRRQRAPQREQDERGRLSKAKTGSTRINIVLFCLRHLGIQQCCNVAAPAYCVFGFQWRRCWTLKRLSIRSWPSYTGVVRGIHSSESSEPFLRIVVSAPPAAAIFLSLSFSLRPFSCYSIHWMTMMSVHARRSL